MGCSKLTKEYNSQIPWTMKVWSDINVPENKYKSQIACTMVVFVNNAIERNYSMFSVWVAIGRP